MLLRTDFIEDRSASVSDHILKYAEDHDVDLIIMGMHGGRARALFLGSTVESVVREALCPVFAVRDSQTFGSKKSFERILVPVDFSPYSQYRDGFARSDGHRTIPGRQCDRTCDANHTLSFAYRQGCPAAAT
jgi:hypothetical protein